MAVGERPKTIAEGHSGIDRDLGRLPGVLRQLLLLL